MSSFLSHLEDFLHAVECDTARADNIIEIKVKSDLFFIIAHELLKTDSRGLFTDQLTNLKECKSYILTTSFSNVKIVRDVEEEIQEKRQKIEQLKREIEELKNE
jgi:type II secretory pathway component HofQ